MKVVPYLNFKGNAEQALNFYVSALDGNVNSIMRFGDHEMPGVTDENKHLIMHAEISFGDNLIYLSDSFEPDKMVLGNAHTIHLDCFSDSEIQSVFEKLSEGGTIVNPLADTFWGATFGFLIDQFGVNWSFNFQKS